jgi:hypothetical protein
LTGNAGAAHATNSEAADDAEVAYADRRRGTRLSSNKQCLGAQAHEDTGIHGRFCGAYRGRVRAVCESARRRAEGRNFCAMRNSHHLPQCAGIGANVPVRAVLTLYWPRCRKTSLSRMPSLSISSAMSGLIAWACTTSPSLPLKSPFMSLAAARPNSAYGSSSRLARTLS